MKKKKKEKTLFLVTIWLRMSVHIALASVAACVSGIVLERKMPKQQGAGDKQAIRDSLKKAMVANIVEGVRTLVPTGL